MKYRLYDIKYKQPNGIIDGTLPNSIIVDLSKYKADIGFGNLNCRGAQAIKDVTGFEADFFKAELVSRYTGTDHKDLTKKEFPVYLDYERHLKKYTITIQRNQIAEAEIEVEAETLAEAEELALNKAEDCDANFEEVDYNFDIINIESEDEDEA